MKHVQLMKLNTDSYWKRRYSLYLFLELMRILLNHNIYKIFDYLRTFGLVPVIGYLTLLFSNIKLYKKPIVCVHKYNSKYVRDNDLSLTNK